MERHERLGPLLREALNAGRFSLVYQPQVRLADQRIVGLEALSRCSLQPRGDVPPEEFMPAVASQGLLDDYRQWLLSTLLQDTQSLLMRHPVLGLSLNFSLNEVMRPAWRDAVLAWLQQMPAGAVPRLTVEITEHTYAGSVPTVVANMQPLRQRGVRFAMDDFGVGASQMERLQALPFDAIKLDKTCVQQLHTPEMQVRVNEVLAYARLHQQQVVAEGVETLEQAQHVQALGIDMAQGFYFGKAQPISHWLAAPTRFA